MSKYFHASSFTFVKWNASFLGADQVASHRRFRTMFCWLLLLAERTTNQQLRASLWGIAAGSGVPKLPFCLLTETGQKAPTATEKCVFRKPVLQINNTPQTKSVPLRKPEVFCLSPFPLFLCQRLLGHRCHSDEPFSGDEVCGRIAFSPEVSLFPFLLGSINRLPREEPFLYLRCDALQKHRLVKN